MFAKVKWWNQEKGYGVVSADGVDILVHRFNLMTTRDKLLLMLLPLAPLWAEKKFFSHYKLEDGQDLHLSFKQND